MLTKKIFFDLVIMLQRVIYFKIIGFVNRLVFSGQTTCQGNGVVSVHSDQLEKDRSKHICSNAVGIQNLLIVIINLLLLMRTISVIAHLSKVS